MTIALKESVNMNYVKSMEYATAIISGKTVQLMAVFTLKAISNASTAKLITGIPKPKGLWIQDFARLSNGQAIAIALGEDLSIWYNQGAIAEGTVLVINSMYIKD